MKKGEDMKIYWELDIDSLIAGSHAEHLIRKNNDGSHTLLGTARTQKQYSELNKKYPLKQLSAKK